MMSSVCIFGFLDSFLPLYTMPVRASVVAFDLKRLMIFPLAQPTVFSGLEI